MVEFAVFHARLNKRGKDGATKRDHLEAAQRMSNRILDELIPPPLDIAAMHVWRDFVELSNSRQSGMAANPISYTEISHYQRITATRLEPWEVRAIRAMDTAVLAIMNDA